MVRRFSSRLLAVSSIVAIAVVWSGWQSATQAQGRAKRPLSYDAYDYWRSIQGTRLSEDGQWVAYALTSQGRGRRAHRPQPEDEPGAQARRAGRIRQFTPDGKFVVFTIVPTKADDERNGRGQNAGPAAHAGWTRQAPRPGRTPTRRRATRSASWRSPGGEVTTVEQIATFRLPEESSTWLAYHKGRAGGAARWTRRRGGRGGAAAVDARAAAARAGGGGAPAGGGRRRRRRRAAAGRHAGRRGTQPAERRKDPGQRPDHPQSHDRAGRHDSRSHRIRVGQDRHDGWSTRCRPTTRRRTACSRAACATARCTRSRPAAAITRACRSTRRHADRVPERHGGVRQAGVAVPALLLEDRRTRRRSRWSLRRRAACVGQGRQRRLRAALLRRRRAAAPRHRSAAGPAARSERAAPTPCAWTVELEGRADSADAAGARDAGAQSQLPRGRPPVRQAARAARDAGSAQRQSGRSIRLARSAPRTSPIGRRCRGTRRTTTSISSTSRTAQRKKVLEHYNGGDSMSPGGNYLCISMSRPATGSPTTSPTARA